MGMIMRNRKCYTGKVKDRSQYSTDEQFTGEYWVDGKPVYQKTINFGALPNATQKLVAHGISNLDYTIDVRGIALNPNSVSYSTVTVPAPSTGTNVVTVYTTDTNVGVTTGGDRSAYTICYITILYTKT